MIQEYKFRVLREAEESKRKQIEADGISAFQKTVSQGISDSYLRWRGIEATLQLALSPNSKVVVIGAGKDGLPIILGNDTAASQSAAPNPHPRLRRRLRARHRRQARHRLPAQHRRQAQCLRRRRHRQCLVFRQPPHRQTRRRQAPDRLRRLEESPARRRPRQPIRPPTRVHRVRPRKQPIRPRWRRRSMFRACVPCCRKSPTCCARAPI